MFKHLIGNDLVKHTLKLLFSNGRVPNSFLFVGDEGVGKREFALELARGFLCLGDGSDGACGVCPACVRVGEFDIPAAGDNKKLFEKVFHSKHGDVAMAVPFKNFLLVDAVRDLEREANFLPFEGKARFFIVDDADKMNDQAANALLKILEEPPATSYIFLITSRPDSLLPTIRSRCQVLRFAPVTRDEIERFLIEERAFTHDEARLAATLARGSVGRAVSMDIADFCERRRRMLDVLKSAIVTGEHATLMRLSDELSDAKNKERFADDLDTLESLIHDLWSLRVAGDPTRLSNSDLAEELSGLADGTDPRRLADWLAAVETLRQELTVNINRRLATAALFAEMAAA